MRADNRAITKERSRYKAIAESLNLELASEDQVSPDCKDQSDFRPQTGKATRPWSASVNESAINS